MLLLFTFSRDLYRALHFNFKTELNKLVVILNIVGKRARNKNHLAISSFPKQVVIQYIPLMRFRDDVVDHDIDHRTGSEGKCIR